ncbi:hypothetical protein [Castellaniella sp. GW247-6E4]|uniref:hypothetical protein n=1 Tax=Castellaniella sp. GW247-6E4 TaxID=3140380 RepID=UPI00331518DD
MNLKSLEQQQILNLVNTGQIYEAWLATGRDTLALSLRRHASRNRRIGLGTIPPQIAHDLRQIARERPEAAITSYHALYAYAMLTTAQLASLDLAQPIATITCQTAHSIVCIDQAGFAVMMRLLDPVEYLDYSDQVSAQAIRAMMDEGSLPERLPAWIRS